MNARSEWRPGDPIRSRSDAIAAGRAHARARGDRLSPTQIVRLAALIRPHLDALAETEQDAHLEPGGHDG
ncbi:hypothetical protein E1281_25975 [Actinomadura sp. KC345]|uniref:hypothetical protein n=1 Tax=Actinomadura sp. KC345 TaxID=2530371 RepID=UPI00104792DF|nr:hypothetical protein [Actinomadura sp. KC345]TDC47652.1 hypothetical protein E1281_25975 [Actinomadura sp. KC345]